MINKNLLKKAFQWEDICQCGEYDPFHHTHKFKFNKISECTDCKSKDVENVSQIFSSGYIQNSWFLQTVAKCHNCDTPLINNESTTIEEYLLKL